jgi:hypothetical protein
VSQEAFERERAAVDAVARQIEEEERAEVEARRRAQAEARASRDTFLQQREQLTAEQRRAQVRA